MGPINTSVVLGFRRGSTVYHVNVTRVWDPSQEELNAVMGGSSTKPVGA